MGTSGSSLARSSRRKGTDSSSRNGGGSIRGSRTSTGASGSSTVDPLSLSPPRDTRSSSSRGVDGSGSGRIKLSLFKKPPTRHREDIKLPSLPGGATSATTGRGTVSPTPPASSRSRSSEASSEALSCADSRNSASGALSRSCVMSTRTASREGRPRTADSACSRSGRMSIRISRQPSTYGELKVLVETNKLGGGVIRGLVGEKRTKRKAVPYYFLCRLTAQPNRLTAAWAGIVVHSRGVGAIRWQNALIHSFDCVDISIFPSALLHRLGLARTYVYHIHTSPLLFGALYKTSDRGSNFLRTSRAANIRSPDRPTARPPLNS